MESPPAASWPEESKIAFQTAAGMLLASVRGDFDTVNQLAHGYPGDPHELLEPMMNMAGYAFSALAEAQNVDPVTLTEGFVEASARGLWESE